MTAGSLPEPTNDKPPETLLDSGRMLAEQPRRRAKKPLPGSRYNSQKPGIRRNAGPLPGKGKRDSRSGCQDTYDDMWRSSSECVKNWHLEISGRYLLGGVSETTGVSGTSAELIRRPFLKSIIPWKPEVGRREYRQHVFPGKYRDIVFLR